MIGYMAVEAETTKPAMCQIEMDFLAQAPLGADAKAITDDQHPDHRFGIGCRQRKAGAVLAVAIYMLARSGQPGILVC